MFVTNRLISKTEMKTQTENNQLARSAALKAVCLGPCEKVLDRVAGIREALYAEWRGMLASQERVLRLVLSEAEGLAWQTGVPHLVFPALAEEKVRALARWNTRQNTLGTGRRTVLAD